MAQSLDLVGQTFGRLTVLERGPNSPAGKTRWKCQCVCGRESWVVGSALLNKNTRSCGCLREELRKTHGMHKSPEYAAYRDIVRRCTVPTFKHYHHYGGRGILNKFANFQAFYSEVGDRPGKGYEIDRIDNDGHYEPGNVRWATKKENNKNRRDTIYVTHNGVTKCLADWAQEAAVSYSTLRTRLLLGWDMGRALKEPVRGSRPNRS